jgi:hypothetical protein
MSTEEENKCCDCNEPIDTDGDFGWSYVEEDYLCTSCYESDSNHVSTVIVIDDSEPAKYYIGDHIRMNEFGDDMYGTNLTVNRTYVSTDGWRGYYETEIEGWSKVLDGWTTGGWDDEVARRKQTFNEWVESVISGDEVPPVPVAIVLDPTSNVFSTGVSVLTPFPDRLTEWLGETQGELHKALS